MLLGPQLSWLRCKEYYNHKYRILKDKELNLLLFDIIQIDNFFGSHVNKNYVQHIQKFSIIHDDIYTNFVFHPWIKFRVLSASNLKYDWLIPHNYFMTISTILTPQSQFLWEARLLPPCLGIVLCYCSALSWLMAWNLVIVARLQNLLSILIQLVRRVMQLWKERRNRID